MGDRLAADRFFYSTPIDLFFGLLEYISNHLDWI